MYFFNVRVFVEIENELRKRPAKTSVCQEKLPPKNKYKN